MLNMYSSFGKVVQFDKLPDPTGVWELGQVIGEGTYGEVYRGFSKKTGRAPTSTVHRGCAHRLLV